MADRKRGSDERDESGQFAAEHGSEDYLAALRDHDGMASTTEVADAIGVPQSTAYYNLDQLRDRGEITSKKVGQSVLWIVDDG